MASPAGARAGARAVERLPAAVLRCLFHCLPLSAHGPCALVCRSWHASVPDTTRVVAQWMRQGSRRQREMGRHLAAGYQDRIRPWLISQSSPWLPALERQHQWLVQLQEHPGQEAAVQVSEPARQRLQAAQRLFSALVQYSLHRQCLEADDLPLQPVPLPGRCAPMAIVDFSPCSRWLATAQPRHSGEKTPLLRVYGWRQGGWQPEPLDSSDLLPAARQLPVKNLFFSEAETDRLFSVHAGEQLISWRRCARSGVWQPTLVLGLGDNHKLSGFMVNGDGDLFLLFQTGSGTQRLLVMAQTPGGDGWGPLSSQDYRAVIAWVQNSDSRQVAIAARPDEAEEGPDWLHICGRALKDPQSGRWTFMPHRLREGQKVLQLRYSPDDRHLLGWLEGQRAALWRVDNRHQLQQTLDVGCLFGTTRLSLAAMRPFCHTRQQLALPLSLHWVVFYSPQEEGQWQPVDSLPMAPSIDDWPGDSLRYIVLSAEGDSLVRVGRRQLTIWHRTAAGGWLRQGSRVVEDVSAPVPNAWRQPPFGDLCVTSCWREGQLEFHGHDRHGQLVCKAAAASGRPVHWWACSTDGLSQITACGWSEEMVLLHMMARPAGSAHKALSPSPQQRALPSEPEPAQPSPSLDATDALLLEPLPDAVHLPRELLERIFCYLSLSDHSQCALVCRRWYASLPALRGQLALWLERRSFAQRAGARHLGGGYTGCPRSFLQACNSPMLPAVERQYRAVLRLQASVTQPGAALAPSIAPGQKSLQAARRLLSGVLHYSLHQQMMRIGADQLKLQTVQIFPVQPGSVRVCEFSPCGRWLATKYQSNQEGITFLMLFGVQQGRWQAVTLLPAPEEPVRSFRFSAAWPDSLFSVHGQGLFLWRPDPDSGDWQPELLWHSSALVGANWLMGCENGDLVVPILERAAGMTRLLLFGAPREGALWRPEVHVYDTSRLCWAFLPATCQLALGQPGLGPDRYDNLVHIWHRGPAAAAMAPWRCQSSAIGCQEAALRSMVYSPDCTCLLVLFANRYLRVLAIDEWRALRPLLTVPCCILPARGSLRAQVAWRHDSQQLAVPYSPHKIQLWNRQADDSWQPGERIESLPESDGMRQERPEDSLRQLMLSDDGRTLARVTDRCLEVWHKDPVWRRQRVERAAAGQPLLCWSGQEGPAPDLSFCTAAADPEGTLSVYGPDSQGQIVRKGRLATGAPLSYLSGSPDGLSFLVTTDEAGLMVQLAGPADPETADGSQQRPSPA